jgi:hypothetical protein
MPGLDLDSSERIQRWTVRFMGVMGVVSILGLGLLQVLPKIPDPAEIAVVAAASEEQRMIDEQARQLAIRNQDRRTKQTRLALAGSILFPLLAWGYHADYRQRLKERLEAEAEHQAASAAPGASPEGSPPMA